MNNKKIFLSELPKEEIKKMILYPSAIWNDIYEIVAEDNDWYVNELANEILGKGYNEWTNTDSTSYTWWMNIKPGHYAETLNITAYDYFSEEDVRRIKKLQEQVRELKDKVENLDGDDPEYYDKIDEWEDRADELADEIIQIVVRELKLAEEVTDEQCVETFIDNDYGDLYYFYEGDKGTVYRNYTKSYKTNYKEGE